MSDYIISSFDKDCPEGHQGHMIVTFGPMVFLPKDMDHEKITKEIDRAYNKLYTIPEIAHLEAKLSVLKRQLERSK